MPNRQVKEVIQGASFATVELSATVREVAVLMKKHHSSAILVVDKKHRLVGICTERDVVFDVVAEGHDPDQALVAKIMTEEPQTISPDKPFGHALHLMYEGGFRHVPVVDGIGRPLGVLSARDALVGDARQFEHELIQREEITVIL
jgi:CBS domain-containing protein